MDSFNGKVAVVTGGGTGMGRDLCLQLVKEGCAVATCDVIMENVEETKALCETAAPGVKVTIHQCDVSSEQEMNRFRDEVVAEHGDKINLVFNNAGIAGGGSIVTDEDREGWDRTFNVCWQGVLNGTRAFLPFLVNADEGHVINTSSLNGFYASVGPHVPHTSYCAAKFAVKGFSEALITDLRLHAPHVKVSVVMPGHIGTSIAINSGRIHGRKSALELDESEIREVRQRMLDSGGPMSEAVMNLSDDQLREVMSKQGEAFRDNAPMTAAEAATVILDAVKAGKWRILVGADAQRMDKRVRANPDAAYEIDFFEQALADGDLGGLTRPAEAD